MKDGQRRHEQRRSGDFANDLPSRPFSQTDNQPSIFHLMKTFLIFCALALGSLLFTSSCETSGESLRHDGVTTTNHPDATSVDTYTTRGY